MKFFHEKTPPAGYTEETYGNETSITQATDNEIPVQCPSHTTERKLMARIDLHVMPFLCIMYRKLKSKVLDGSACG